MCLVVEKEKKLQKATKDIIAYKVVIKREDSYISPFQKYPITLNTVLKNRDKIEYEKADNKWDKRVEGGVFHLIAEEKDARMYLKKK